MGMSSSGGGEIVQVQGGHILRSTGRKDRHSKVYTAKGPRDRRVRLSAPTAIQFYDVQDRLGFDRPSKAVDWLIKKAKNAIDKLAQLPPWNPNEMAPNDGSGGMALESQSEPSSGHAFQLDGQLGENPIDAQSISDTMKSFFPTTSGMNFQNYPGDIMSRASIQTEDLCLSLHSLQDPNSTQTPPTNQDIFSGSSPVIFEGNYPRMVGWDGGAADGENRGGFLFNSQTVPQEHMLCQNSAAFSQREPLQSSFSPSVRAWNDLQLTSSDHQFSTSNAQFALEHFSGFQVPVRIHGEEPSSASTNFLH